MRIHIFRVASCLALWIACSGTVTQAVDPLPVQHLCVHSPDLGAKWGIEDSVPIVNYPASRFTATDPEGVLTVVENCQRGLLRGSKMQPEWFVACRDRLAAGEANPKVRGALVNFLLNVNDSASAQVLWTVAQMDPAVQESVELKLVEWKSPVAIESWRERLRGAPVSTTLHQLACQGLGIVGEKGDAEILESVLRNRKYSLGIRYAAADGIARLDSERSLKLIEDVVAGKIAGVRNEGEPSKNPEGPVWDTWLATSLLISEKENERTKALLIQAISEGSNTARTVALRRLAAMSADEFKNQLERVRNDNEINVRLEVLKFLANHVEENAIVLLNDYTGDSHPAVRESARNELLKLADDAQWRTIVEREISKSLRSDKWWQVQQALIAAGSLMMHAEQQQCFDLLKHEQPEVYVTAAWALRVIAKDEAIIQQIVAYAKSETDRIFEGKALPEPEYHRAAHLLEAMAIRTVPEGRPILEKYVPKNQQAGIVSRMSGLWGMGQYLKGKPERKFSDAYITIIYDKMGFGAEFGVMRYAAMVGLGYFADPETKDKIIACEEGEISPIGLAKAWTLRQIESREEAKKEEKPADKDGAQ